MAIRARSGGRLMWAQERICPLCGRRFSPNPDCVNVNDAPSVDHVLPLSKGGYSGWGNVLCVHRGCNGRKGDDLPTGCQIIWLIAVCERLRVPVKLQPGIPWYPPKLNASEHPHTEATA